ncbi:unnamed protein product [Linum trigynum]|uniref:Uncharacterized protein n=1 Tax=Linum trigynum TaxID=586398 RepID=A0AAV2CHV5_9ROSI
MPSLHRWGYQNKKESGASQLEEEGVRPVATSHAPPLSPPYSVKRRKKRVAATWILTCLTSMRERQVTRDDGSGWATRTSDERSAKRRGGRKPI